MANGLSSEGCNITPVGWNISKLASLATIVLVVIGIATTLIRVGRVDETIAAGQVRMDKFERELQNKASVSDYASLSIAIEKKLQEIQLAIAALSEKKVDKTVLDVILNALTRQLERNCAQQDKMLDVLIDIQQRVARVEKADIK